MPIASKLATLCLFIGTSVAFGQSTTQEDLGTVTAASLSSGLGWSVGSNEVEFAAAAAAGATHVRIDACEWSYVEGQSAPPNNVSTGYSLPSSCVASLQYAKKYGLQPTVVASYGSPYHPILTLKLTSPATAGATTIAVEYSAGEGGKTLSSMSFPYDYILQSNKAFISNKNSYDGVLVTDISLAGSNAATLTLSSALKAGLPAGTSLTVNEILYPSPVTASPDEPSVIAYAHYAQYLAQQVSAYGLKGEVELWNEPTWGADCWDNRRNCYDVDPQVPGELPSYNPNYGFAAALQKMTPVAGVPYVWAGTNKTGSTDLLNKWMATYSGTTYVQGQEAVASESFHPYGSNPEDAMWNEPCVRSSTTVNQAQLCTTTGSLSNMVAAEARSLFAKASNPNGGMKHSITETGASSLYMPADHMARFATRQFLGYMAADISYIEFYRLSDTSTPGQSGFGFVTLGNQNTTYTPLPAYTALAGIMADLAPIQSDPVTSYPASSLPSVTSYSGTWNLDHLAVVGARAGDKANSIAYMLWQRSFSPVMCQIVPTPCWASVPSPLGAETTVSIPSGLKIAQVVNLDTRASVGYRQSGTSVTLEVSDDPIELMLIPNGDSTSVSLTPKLIFESVPAQKQGSSVAVHAFSASTGPITYSIVSGPASVSGSTVTTTGPGTVVVEATQAAKGNYTSATATASFSTSAQTPTISFDTIPARIYGATVKLTASSPSKGAITFSIVSGPATVSGVTLTTTGVGTVVVGASQVANGTYTAATGTTSFTVSPATTTLSFVTIPAKTYGDVFPVSASSASNGPITYTVTSGPATIAGSTLTTTGSGEVWLKATQAASSNYNAATATCSFYVKAATPNLVFQSIANQPYGSTLNVKASSESPNAITYSVVSGPASYVGSAVTTKSTSGTVVVKAIQSGGGSWATATATTSFTVSPTAAPTISIASISPKNVGDSFSVSATSSSTGALTYSVGSGPATISGATVTTTGPGTVVIVVKQAASGKYSEATATTSVPVASSVPAPKLALAPISSKVYGNVFSVGATSNSTSPITYSIVSGAASISGSTVTVTGYGSSVVVKATQASSSQYAAASTTTSFDIKLLAPSLVIPAVAPKAAGNAFKANAISDSEGAITFTIVSGPAKISNGMVTLTGKGTVVLRADQLGYGPYGPANTRTNVQVN